MTQKAKKELYEAGEEVVLEAVNSYIAEIQENGTAERYIMYGSTFLIVDGVTMSKNQNRVLRLQRKNRKRSLLIYGVRDNGVL